MYTNGNIRLKYIEDHIDEVNVTALSYNSFTLHNKIIRLKLPFWQLENAKNRLPRDININIVKNFL